MLLDARPLRPRASTRWLSARVFARRFPAGQAAWLAARGFRIDLRAKASAVKAKACRERSSVSRSPEREFTHAGLERHFRPYSGEAICCGVLRLGGRQRRACCRPMPTSWSIAECLQTTAGWPVQTADLDFSASACTIRRPSAELIWALGSVRYGPAPDRTWALRSSSASSLASSEQALPQPPSIAGRDRAYQRQRVKLLSLRCPARRQQQPVGLRAQPNVGCYGRARLKSNCAWRTSGHAGLAHTLDRRGMQQRVLQDRRETEACALRSRGRRRRIRSTPSAVRLRGSCRRRFEQRQRPGVVAYHHPLRPDYFRRSSTGRWSPRRQVRRSSPVETDALSQQRLGPRTASDSKLSAGGAGFGRQPSRVSAALTVRMASARRMPAGAALTLSVFVITRHRDGVPPPQVLQVRPPICDQHTRSWWLTGTQVVQSSRRASMASRRPTCADWQSDDRSPRFAASPGPLRTPRARSSFPADFCPAAGWRGSAASAAQAVWTALTAALMRPPRQNHLLR